MEIRGHSINELSSSLVEFEDSIELGKAATISLLGTNPLTQQELIEFRDNILANGFHLDGRISQNTHGEVVEVKIPLKKGSPVWALLIPLIPLAVIAGLVVFSIVSLDRIKNALLPIILAVGGLFVLVLIVKGPGQTYVQQRPEMQRLTVGA